MQVQDTHQWGWVELPGETLEGHSVIHIVPQNDITGHTFDETCKCAPHEDDECPDVWHHNAFDGREEYEFRGRKPH
jgi:hypothetical protein